MSTMSPYRSVSVGGALHQTVLGLFVEVGLTMLVGMLFAAVQKKKTSIYLNLELPVPGRHLGI
jgi:hypothetical protein